MTTWRDTQALSVLYDTLLFTVIVSISTALLLPAFTNQLSDTAILETHRQIYADDVLTTLLASTATNLSATFYESDLNETITTLGINASNTDLLTTLNKIIDNIQPTHLPYSELISIDLLSQLHLNSENTSLQPDPLAAAFHTMLVENLQNTLQPFMQGRYNYNLTASWHPLIDLSVGGSLALGPRPPAQSTYVTSRRLGLPISFIYRQDNYTVTLTHEYLTTLCTGFLNASTIPEFINITKTLDDYDHQHHPSVNDNMTKDDVQKNITHLIDKFLIEGLYDIPNMTSFPGILPIILSTLLHLPENNASIDNIVSTVTPQFNETQEILTREILNQSRIEFLYRIQPLLRLYTNGLLASSPSLSLFQATFTDLLLDRVAFSDVTVTLTLWLERS